MTPTCFATFGPVVGFHHPQPTSLKVTRQCRSHPASNELDERAASVMIVGSHTIGNFTELAMKHARWASACKGRVCCPQHFLIVAKLFPMLMTYNSGDSILPRLGKKPGDVIMACEILHLIYANTHLMALMRF